MNTPLHTALLAIALGLATTASFAQDKMMKDSMTMQQCKDHMAMKKKDGMKADEMAMKKDKVCADMMKKEGMMKDGAASEPSKM